MFYALLTGIAITAALVVAVRLATRRFSPITQEVVFALFITGTGGIGAVLGNHFQDEKIVQGYDGFLAGCVANLYLGATWFLIAVVPKIASRVRQRREEAVKAAVRTTVTLALKKADWANLPIERIESTADTLAAATVVNMRTRKRGR